MKRFWAVLFSMSFLFVAAAGAGGLTEDEAMKIKMNFDNKVVVVKMADNEAAKQFVGMLPATFDFTDFAGEEKISEFPRPVSLENVPRGMIATKGKMFIYTPWGNFGFFYKDHGSHLDKSLVELGEVESGLEYLIYQKGGFSAEISVLK